MHPSTMCHGEVLVIVTMSIERSVARKKRAVNECDVALEPRIPVCKDRTAYLVLAVFGGPD